MIKKVSSLKYRTLNSRRILENTVNAKGDEEDELRTFQLPELPLLTLDVEELQRQITLHKVNANFHL